MTVKARGDHKDHGLKVTRKKANKRARRPLQSGCFLSAVRAVGVSSSKLRRQGTCATLRKNRETVCVCGCVCERNLRSLQVREQKGIKSSAGNTELVAPSNKQLLLSDGRFAPPSPSRVDVLHACENQRAAAGVGCCWRAERKPLLCFCVLLLYEVDLQFSISIFGVSGLRKKQRSLVLSLVSFHACVSVCVRDALLSSIILVRGRGTRQGRKSCATYALAGSSDINSRHDAPRESCRGRMPASSSSRCRAPRLRRCSTEASLPWRQSTPPACPPCLFVC